jgi:hypothetical protein
MPVAGRLAALSLAASLALAATFEGRATREAPPPGHTGGFGEPTCQDCHFQAEVNQGSGTVELLGLPDAYVSDATYDVTVVLTQAGLAAGGFQTTARFQEGSQAGELVAPPAEHGRAGVTAEGDIRYAHHLYGGTYAGDGDTMRWQLQWIAPGCGLTVVFHVAANAADGDDSPLGDFVYTTSAVVPPADATTTCAQVR